MAESATESTAATVEPSPGPSFVAALVSGGIAGTSVDVALYPLDTLKTRLQSAEGFFKAGGFRGVYNGISAAALGSAPGAALFFSTYEISKRLLQSPPNQTSQQLLPVPVVHMLAASAGEVVACLVRVPTEVVKQRMQAGRGSAILSTLQQIVLQEGAGIRGLYRGYGITVMREIPFACIQFPLYELMKSALARWFNRPARAHEAAVCGSVAGAVAAAATTPLDVLKTRLMLGKDASGVPYKGPLDTFLRVKAEGLKQYKDSIQRLADSSSNSSGSGSSSCVNSSGNSSVGGVSRGVSGSNGSSLFGGSAVRSRWSVFFSGVQPRVMWISVGGFVFLGAYEQALRITQPMFP